VDHLCMGSADHRTIRVAREELAPGAVAHDETILSVVEGEHAVDAFDGAEQAIAREASRRFHFLALGDVPNGARDECTLVGFERAQADFDREFAAVLAHAEKLDVRAHRARFRGARIARSVYLMLRPK